MKSLIERHIPRGDFPPEFDPISYRARYDDLKHLDFSELRQHWETFGIKEGRHGNRLNGRAEFVDLIPNGSRVLEIGPFNAPLKAGSNVMYFDVLDKSGLIGRAQSIGFATSSIPTIDFVSPDGDLSTVTETFDYILSSHVLEHQPNLVKHLNDVHELLNDGGYYFLIVPDKRYCFDHFLPETSLARVLEAHVNNNTRHSLASVIEHRALTTHNDCLRHWLGDHGERYVSVKERCQAAIAEYQRSQGQYIDVHAWYFSPDTFRQIIEGLRQASLVSFSSVRVYDTYYGAIEFFAILR